ncbi:MAG: C4-dicarboxylate ABC transporter substrate-binding protein, partial [Desulfovibrionaceae bacterium]|nr:C4-dicarboxylate ABC transporter substrate-binding protein [Desulfovibrionaceae bacterium]
MMRTLLTACAAVLLSASLCLAAPITMKLGHIAEPDNPYGQGADYFAKLVKERTNGEVDI